jgi:hypothetical protein
MRRALLMGWVALGAACATSASADGPAADAVKSLPRATGRVTVRGGELLALEGATVRVDQVTYLDQPCPKDVLCVHSGVIRMVGVTVTHGGAPASGGVSEGRSQVLAGVEVRVLSVAAGPMAVIEASLPVAPR